MRRRRFENEVEEDRAPKKTKAAKKRPELQYLNRERILKDLFCPLCLDPCHEPRFHLGTCGQMFCLECIIPIMRTTKECPSCKESIHPADLVVSQRLVLNLLNDLQVTCPSCQKAVTRGNLTNHKSVCPKIHAPKPTCRYGYSCRERDNPNHYSQFSHPVPEAKKLKVPRRFFHMLERDIGDLEQQTNTEVEFVYDESLVIVTGQDKGDVEDAAIEIQRAVDKSIDNEKYQSEVIVETFGGYTARCSSLLYNNVGLFLRQLRDQYNRQAIISYNPKENSLVVEARRDMIAEIHDSFKDILRNLVGQLEEEEEENRNQNGSDDSGNDDDNEEYQSDEEDEFSN